MAVMNHDFTHWHHSQCLEIGYIIKHVILLDIHDNFSLTYKIVENETHFVLTCPLHNPIRDKFSTIFKNVGLESLKSFFQ